LLARFLKRGWVPTVPTPSPQIRELRTRLQARDKLVAMTPKLKDRGHGALTRQGLLIDAAGFTSARGRHRRAATAGLPEAARQIFLGVLQQLESLEQALAPLEAEGVQAGTDRPGLRRVVQLPGISLLSGLGL
jgi:transposase